MGCLRCQKPDHSVGANGQALKQRTDKIEFEESDDGRQFDHSRDRKQLPRCLPVASGSVLTRSKQPALSNASDQNINSVLQSRRIPQKAGRRTLSS
jgi:hypothetical protein